MTETHPTHPPTGKGFFDAPPKTTFVFGLISGVAAMALVGLAVLLPLANASKGSPKATTTGTTTNTTPTNTAAPTDANGLTTTVSPIRAVTSDDYVRGPAGAKVTIVEYSDFQCPFCGQFHPTMERLMQDYPTQIRWVYRHFPLTSLHPQAQPAAEAAECAAAQGKFWEYADALFANQQSLASTYYPELAKTLKLNVDKFNTCVAAGDGRARISADVQDGTANGVNGTPTSFLNGRAVPGAYPYDTMKTYVDSLLASS